MKIVVIDNYDSFVFNLVRYLRELKSTKVSVMRNTNLNLAELKNCDAILLSPGPGIPKEAGLLGEVIKDYSEQKKILGVCLGHQALAEHFDLELEPCPQIFHGKSSSIYQTKNTDLFKDLPYEFEVGRYHSWQVKDFKTHQNLEVIARTQNEEIMALQHKTLPIYGVQFHPESILTKTGRTIIENWVKL